MNAEVKEGELVREVDAPDQALVQAISRAEIDQAIHAAHQRPRSISKFMGECTQLCTLNEQVADECIYALPRDGKMLEGPSARMGEIIAYTFRNNRTGGRVTDIGRDFITAQGVFQDLERNTYITYEVQRRITTKNGVRFGADMIQVTGNAAVSIALRNATLKGVPKALWWDSYLAALKVCAGDARTLVARRTEALQALTKVGATKDMVCTFLGVAGTDDITLEHVAQLRGIHNAIRDGEISIDTAFNPKSTEEPKATTRAEQAKETLRKTAPTPKDEPAKTETAPAEQQTQASGDEGAEL